MVKVPTAKELMRPTINALIELRGSGNISEIFDEILRQNDFSDDVINEPMKNDSRTRLSYNAFWARTHLGGIGVLEKLGNGVWLLTPLGRTIDDEKMSELHKKFLEKRKKKAASRKRASEKTSDSLEDNDWKGELLGRVKKLSPDAFERLSQQLLRVAGFVDVNRTGAPNDGGIDGTGILRMNLVSFRVLFQCKRYDGSVSANTVRDFRGAMQGRADRGLIITTGTFTSAARDEATRDGAPLIDLINGEELCELLKDNKLGVKTEMVEQVSVDEDWFEKNF